MANNTNGCNDFQARAVFLTGVTDFGNEILRFFPDVQISETMDHALCLKSMPMACQDGDMLITRIGNMQAVCVSRLIPSFEEDTFKTETFATLGLLIPPETNPIPYYKIISNLMQKLDDEGKLNKETLVNTVPKLYKQLNTKLQSL